MEEEILERPKDATRLNMEKRGCNSRYRGVIYQHNGNWGAQIYANHHRIWLGTFKTEAAAVVAYDNAVIKLHHQNAGDPHKNFPFNAFSIHEPSFQANYTNDEVLNMIKDGFYQMKFDEFLFGISRGSNHNNDNSSGGDDLSKQGSAGTMPGFEWYFCQQLFTKELTPSDVGKLGRLVIPKRYALMHFPIEGGHHMEMILHDKTMKRWNFRYCYWKSSKSFVFTRGWSKFVKVNELEAKDIVTFYMCKYKEKNDGENVRKIWIIDMVKNNNGDQLVTNNNDTSEGGDSSYENEMQIENPMLVEEQEVAVETKKDSRFRLFGVQV